MTDKRTWSDPSMIPSSLISLLLLLQAGTHESTPAPKPIVLKAARLFDGKSDALIQGGMVIVEGHTDNIPIHTAQFASNWELSTARSTAIARLLLERGPINPANLSAAGYAEFHPVASNITEDGRMQNRRVDIILLRHPAASQ